MREEDIEPLRAALNKKCTLTEDDFIPKVHIDVAIDVYKRQAYGSGGGETVGDHGAGQTGRSEDIKVTAKRGYTGGNGTALTSKTNRREEL